MVGSFVVCTEIVHLLQIFVRRLLETVSSLGQILYDTLSFTYKWE
jgi:hypothetical protein